MDTEIRIALIFDEVITGFRLHLAALRRGLGFADLVNYGRSLVACAMGVLAGKATFMDTGRWDVALRR